MQESKELGYIVIQENKNYDIYEEYLNLKKHYKQIFDIHSSNFPHNTYFTHIFIKKIIIGNFDSFGRVICMFLHSEYGYRYNKEDIDHMIKIIEKFIGRDINFLTTEIKTAEFYAVKPIRFSEKLFHIENQ